ncbi:hypothetical protein [Rhodococcus jostii]|uniref:hypothetical protein n=1 Tax=Rhodococcus jostii TaxID=132919 RepID=UPI00366019B8
MNAPADYEEILQSAHRGELFELCVYTGLLEADAFPEHRPDLVQLSEHARAAREHLQRLPGHQLDRFTRTETAARADEYRTLISRLGWTEFINATLDFGYAALYRLYQLNALAPEPIRPAIMALTEHYKAVVTATQLLHACPTGPAVRRAHRRRSIPERRTA